MTGVHDAVVDGSKLICEVDTAHLGQVLRRLTSVGVNTLMSAPPTLEELFLSHYAAGASPREKSA
jgi:ABC-2 type transport system ATP-binding protein